MNYHLAIAWRYEASFCLRILLIGELPFSISIIILIKESDNYKDNDQQFLMLEFS